MIKKSSDKILSVMDPVCLHHDMSGLGVGRSGRVGGGGSGGIDGGIGVRVEGYEIKIYYCVRHSIFMNYLTKYLIKLFNISST